MGCTASKLEDEEAVKLCRERRNLVRKAAEQRSRFAAGHLAYLQSLRQVSDALRSYVDVEEDCLHDFFSDACSTPPFTPVKRLSSPETASSRRSGGRMIHCLRAGGAPAAFTVEERPPPETVEMNSYYEAYDYDGGFDGLFSMGSSAASPPPENPNWDFFWNPFSSLGAYGFSYQGSGEEDPAGLRQIREEEGIPELEDEEELPQEAPEPAIDNKVRNFEFPVREMKQQTREFEPQAVEVAKASEMAEVEEAEEKTPGFTVYLNRRPTSMAHVMRDIEHQFVRMHESAREVAAMLEASKPQRAGKLLNPVALLRSASSRSSSSSRFLPPAAAAAGDDDGGGYESDESGMISGSHHSTLEKLYAWEKKLYEEVKGGERIRVAYEKKCMLLRKQDINGEDPAVVDRTRIAARDLQTLLKVSVHSVEAISSRIDKLRDEELFPQLSELIQGMGRMWQTMTDCHQIQKAAVDGAKHLLATAAAPPAVRAGGGLSRPAARLEAELRNWRSCLKIWVDAQRCYIRALAGWLLRCARAPEDDYARIAEDSPLSPPRSAGAPPVFGLCIQWTKMLDNVSEDRAVEGLDFFASGIYTVACQQREAAAEAARRARSGAAAPDEEDEMTDRWPAPEKMAELAVRVLFAGMSVAVSALAAFAAGSRDGYEDLERRCSSDGGGRESAYLQTPGPSLSYKVSDKAAGRCV